MFKKIATLALSLALTLSAFAQDKKTPLQVENARYAAELEAATKKANALHVVKLKELQKKALAENNLDAALEIREEIKRVDVVKEEEADIKSALVGEWSHKDVGKVVFFKNGTGITGSKEKCVYGKEGDKVVVKFQNGGKWEISKMPTDTCELTWIAGNDRGTNSMTRIVPAKPAVK